MSQFAAPLSSLQSLSGLQALHRALDEAEVQKNALGTQLQALRREEEQGRAALEVSADARHDAWQGPHALLAAGAHAASPNAQGGLPYTLTINRSPKSILAMIWSQSSARGKLFCA